MKRIHIFGGGTVSHVRNHLALTAPAYGTTARFIASYLSHTDGASRPIHLHLTKMANEGKGNLETNQDISNLVDKVIGDPSTKIIFFNPALVDFEGTVVGLNSDSKSGKYESRLRTANGDHLMLLSPAEKIISKIRKERKDIFLVAFKTTCGESEDDQFLTGLNLLKANSCNLVLANDTKTRVNMVITPEQARYHVSTNRNAVLETLVDMTLLRSEGTFTRSTVVPGESVPWSTEHVPASLKAVVDHCIKGGAYKPFNGSTVGHFAFKSTDTEFITSKRKTNFNNLESVGMVRCTSQGPDSVVAEGAKPSVGGQSQRIIFKDHPDVDCIVHFHCPPRPGTKLSIRSQIQFECGSHQCGKNTSEGLRLEPDGIKCVYLDNHGPNIVFNRNIEPQLVIDFIESNFDLTQSTDKVVRN